MGYKDREKQRAFQRNFLKKRREDFFRDKACVRCGSKEALELDHIDRTQKTTHRVWSMSQARRDAEIAKCQVLCKPCHRQKTIEDFGWGKHGIPRRYNLGCRCEACKEAHSISMAKWRGRLWARTKNHKT